MVNSEAQADPQEAVNQDVPIIKSTDKVADGTDEKSAASESPSPANEATTVEQGKKKLSLQERLALASKAKAKKKQLKKQIETEDPAKPQDAASNEEYVESPNDESQKQETESFADEINFLLSTENKDQIIESVRSFIDKQVTKSNKELCTKISELERKLNKANKAPVRDQKDLLQKLQEKELQIQELLEEGTKLSKRELALNQTIKRLKQHESELEDEIESNEKLIETLNERTEKLGSKLTDYDETKKSLIIEKSSLETLKLKYDSVIKANDSLTDELKEIKHSKIDEQLDQVKKELTAEKEEHEVLLKDYDQLNSEYNQYRNEKETLIKNLTKEVEELKTNLADVTNESENEIKRLEEKIESLRFQNESNISNFKAVKNSDKDIELIQNQYDQAKANWKTIEGSYLNKISNCESSIEEVNNMNMMYSKKIKVLTNDLKVKSNLTEELKDNELNLINQLEDLRKKNLLLMTTNSTLENNYRQLKEEFDNEKELFNKKLQELENDRESLKQSLKLRMNDFSTTTTSNPSSFYLQDLSSSSSIFQFRNQFNPQQMTPTLNRSTSNGGNKRFSISVGESSVTPRASTSNFSTQFSTHRLNHISSISTHDKILRHQSSTISIDSTDTQPLGLNLSGTVKDDSNLDIIPSSGDSPAIKTSNKEDSHDDFLTGNYEIPLGMDAEMAAASNGGENSIVSQNPNDIGVGVNVQLIKKLSDQIRMLELEVNTLKEETHQLEKEKDHASNEIVKLIEENSKVEEIRSEIKNKDAEISVLNSKYEKVLILLGEKEEKVGELTADVEDLKDLLKQQVQEMIAMQEAK